MNLLRASSMQLVERCSASVDECHDIPSVGSDIAREGTWKHDAGWLVLRELMPGGEPVAESRFESIRRRYKVSAEDMTEWRERMSAMVSAWDLDQWDEIHFEVDLSFTVDTVDENYRIGAHADILLIKGNTIAIVDLKTGRIAVEDPSINWQFLTYVVGASIAYPKAETFLVHCWGPWQPKTDPVKFTRECAEEIFIDLLQIVERAMGDKSEYTVGEHCKYCPARMTCPALHSDLTEIMKGTPHDLRIPELLPAEQGELLGRLLAAEKIIGQLKGELKAVADASPIPLPDGKTWGPVETKGYRVIDPLIGRDVLSAWLGGDVWKCISVRSGDTLKVVRESDMLPPESKKKDKEFRFWRDLEDAGAITREPKTTYKAYKPGDV